jgi:hypothetical protein
MATDDPRRADRTIEHRVPRTRTVKQLYGTAFRCAEPSCARPLYRVSDETGEWILNSRVAHIKARSEGGPRWDPAMSEEDNRNAANLLALCEPHAFEIDATPDHYPVELLQSWKCAQLDEYRELGKSWPLSKAEAREVVSRSFDHREVAAAHVSATSIVAMARLVATIIETGRLQRRGPLAAALAWQTARERTSRSFPVYDLDGERMAVEPPYVETRAHHDRLQESLETTVSTLTPTATQLAAELHGLRATDSRLSPWCQWVRDAMDAVVAAAGYWPGRPPLADDDIWEQALSELLRASDALAATWRGEPADEPPLVAHGSDLTEEAHDEPHAAEAHRALLDSARPWARVTHRAFDPGLCERLMAATSTVVFLPSLPSLLDVGLSATARLAAQVARNADDDAFGDLIDRAAVSEPLACSITLLRSLMSVARAAQRAELESRALARAQALLRAETWQSPSVWTANGPHCLSLLYWTAEATSVEEVRAMLTTAIENGSEMLLVVLPAMAQWCEHRESQDPRIVTGGSSHIESLPNWFPLNVTVEAIHRRLPNVEPGDEDTSESYPDEVEQLASQVLWIAAQRDEIAAP